MKRYLLIAAASAAGAASAEPVPMEHVLVSVPIHKREAETALPVTGLDGAVEYRHDSAAELDSGTFRLEGGNGSVAFHLSGSARDNSDLEIPGYAINEAAIPTLTRRPPSTVS